MNLIPRHYEDLNPYLKAGKVLVVYGPRQVGKTTLLKKFIETFEGKVKWETGDNIEAQALFSVTDLKKLKEYVEGYDLLIIDEAQRLPQVGQNLKILVDTVPKLKIIATGSSSFELAGQVGEPLTGRKTTLTLFPIAQLELKNLYNKHELKTNLDDYLVYGSYPEIIQLGNVGEKISRLEELMQSYLLKDILELDRIKSPKAVLDLLQLLARQIGQEVSHHELGKQIGMDGKTVARYLDLFEKGFVIYNLRGFSRNLRKEISKKSKYYFYDTGIRNALISDFAPPRARSDKGHLWENFLFMERLKKRSYQGKYANAYFWRSWSQQEIDLIEESNGNLTAFEFKWQEDKAKIPSEWAQNYPEADFKVVNWENYLGFVL